MLGQGRWVAFLYLLLLIPLAEAAGSDARAMKYYGLGVHAFYRGSYESAIQNFDIASGYDNRDPRIYLFRGLAKQRLGYFAEPDFQMGAQLEVALGRRDVGRALERVQGSDRLTVEKYRREARRLPREMVAAVVPPAPAHPVPTPVARPRSRPRPSAAQVEYQAAPLPVEATDPFREDATGLLGRGELRPAGGPAANALASPEITADDPGEAFGDDDPFGSGVAETDAPAAEAPVAGEDIFQFGDEPAAPSGVADRPAVAAPRTPSPAGAPSPPSKPSAMGAALRAFGRGLMPAVPVPPQGQQMLDRFQGQQAGPSDDPFGPAASDSTPNAPNAAGDEGGFSDDPFAPGATDAAAPAEAAPADRAAGDEDAADPFAPGAEDSAPNASGDEGGFSDDPFGPGAGDSSSGAAPSGAAPSGDSTNAPGAADSGEFEDPFADDPFGPK